MLSNLRAELDRIRASPRAGARHGLFLFRNLVNHRKYHGYRRFHEARLLRDYEAFERSLRVVRVGNVNEPEAIDHLLRSAPDLVFVHGTCLIRGPVLESIRAPFVNLHWGWSPEYRGEGVVSALALEGPKALGVTVHLIDEGIDSGDILYRARPVTDPLDNFYSVGLKLTVLGTELFLKVADRYRQRGELDGTKQPRERSRLFSSKYMREHPEMYPRAWRNLRSGSHQ